MRIGPILAATAMIVRPHATASVSPGLQQALQNGRSCLAKPRDQGPRAVVGRNHHAVDELKALLEGLRHADRAEPGGIDVDADDAAGARLRQIAVHGRPRDPHHLGDAILGHAVAKIEPGGPNMRIVAESQRNRLRILP